MRIKRFKNIYVYWVSAFCQVEVFFFLLFFLVLKSLLKRVKLNSKIEIPRKRHEDDTVHISGL